MSHLNGLLARARSLFRRQSAESRMEEEFRFHVEMETARLTRHGIADAEARRRALASFGGLDTHREAMRDGRGARWLADVVVDVRYALRGLRRAPAFAVAVALTLGIGIGVNGIIFGYVDSLLLRPLPAHDPGRLVGLYAVDRQTNTTSELSYEDFVDYRHQNDVFDDLAGMTGVPLNLAVPGRTGVADMVWGEMVTENFFTLLGMRPTVGTFFTELSGARGANPVAVLSYDSWRSRFNGDSAIVGQSVRINGTGFTIVGVAPRQFRGLRTFGFWPEIWVPLGMHDVVAPTYKNLYEGRGPGWMLVVGRLRNGLTMSRAESALSRFAAQLAHDHPETNARLGALLLSARSGFDNPQYAKPAVIALASTLSLFASFVVLAIICANLANLQLARAATRGQEIAVRLSLGCSRSRLARQMLVESAVVASPGALLALLVIRLGPVIEQWLLPHLQFRVGFTSAVDGRVAGVTIVVSLIAMLLFGLTPALRSTRVRSLTSLIGSKRAVVNRSQRIRDVLVVSQLALSVVLLVGATLFVRSLLLARADDPGFDARGRAMMSVNIGLQHYDEARGRPFYDDVLARVRSLPGVASASWAFPLPFDSYGRSVPLFVDGIRGPAKDGSLNVETTVAGDDFVNAVGLRLVAGRGFTAADSAGAPLVMVVSRELAARLWPGQSALGRQARRGGPDGPEVTVVGIVDDATFQIIGPTTRRHVYEPLRQHYRDWQTLIVHTRGDPRAAITPLRSAVAAIDPALPVFGALTMDEAVANGLSMSRSAAAIAGFFGALALLISSVGLYAVVASGVAERTREIGVRVALGATSGEVMRFVMRGGARLGVIGLVIGLVGAAAVARLMSALLFGLSPSDPITFELVPVTLALVVLAATFVPARRAVKLDPVAALRSE
jgi:putative ABC transport system permease protein